MKNLSIVSFLMKRLSAPNSPFSCLRSIIELPGVALFALVTKESAVNPFPKSLAFKSVKPLLTEVDMRLTATPMPVLAAADTTVSSDLWSSRALILTSPAASIVDLLTSAVTLLSKVALVTATDVPSAAKNDLERVAATAATPPSAFTVEVFLASTLTAPTSSVELLIEALTLFSI